MCVLECPIKEIGHALHISTATVSRHLRNICGRFGFRNVLHSVLFFFIHPLELQRHNNLTPREHEIMKMSVEGMSSKEISLILHISLHTVKTHKQNILVKFEAPSMRRAVSKVLDGNTHYTGDRV